MSRRYPPSSYDDNLCLKPPVLLWLAVIFLSRAALLPLASGAGSLLGLNPDSIALLRGFWNVGGLLPSVIAVAVLYALVRREPSAPAFVHRLLSRGRVLLAVAAGSDLLGSLLAGAAPGGLNTQLPPASWLMVAVDAYFLAYVLGARRVRDTFLDTPRLVNANQGRR